VNAITATLPADSIGIRCRNAQRFKWSERHPIFVLTFFVEQGLYHSHVITY
jgi:hypothetical protein